MRAIKTISDRKLESLAQEEAQARIEKLHAELDSIRFQHSARYQSRENIKVVSAFGGLITAVVGILALFFSVYQGLNQLETNANIRIEERISQSYARLAGERIAERLSGISSLKQFLNQPDSKARRHQEILLALSHSLVVEDNPRVRGAIVEAISNLDANVVKKESRSAVIKTLANLSRALIAEVSLYENYPKEATYNHRNLQKNKELNIGILSSVGHAIAGLVQIGTSAEDLSGVFCEECDFTAVNLSGVNFDRAFLRRAIFDTANLSNSSFDRAVLQDTSFIQAKMRGAKITVLPLRDRSDEYSDSSLAWKRIPDGRFFSIAGADFSCADLREADFTGTVIFGAASSGSAFMSHFIFTNLNRANLIGANLSAVSIIYGNDSSSESDSIRSYINYPSGMHAVHGEGFYEIAELDSNATLNPENRSIYRFDVIGDSFLESNWEQAKLPKAFQDYLVKHPPEKRNGPFDQSKRSEIACIPIVDDLEIKKKMEYVLPNVKPQ